MAEPREVFLLVPAYKGTAVLLPVVLSYLKGEPIANAVMTPEAALVLAERLIAQARGAQRNERMDTR